MFLVIYIANVTFVFLFILIVCRNNIYDMILNWKLFLERFVGDNPISNLQSYIDGMSLSMLDKSFFNDKINFDAIVDFGCADGTFLEHIKKSNPNVLLIGYDLDDDMLEKARVRLGDKVLLTSNWDEVINHLSYSRSPVLNLSSVIHEVYSYSSSRVIKKFWEDQVFGGDFKWITIRDMIPSLKMDKRDRMSFKDDVKKVRQKSDSFYLNSFEEKWGDININYRTFMHYLLKYKYTDNWEREVIENYLPVSLETLKTKIPSDHKVVYEKDFILDFLKSQVKRDFNIELTHSTHTKIIIKNNKYK